ncbi:hypothetical protein EJ06DRAFT_562355 [Trichodelitschia bisporula]|uniref:ARID domain-containing protein n=1 Tax=Trichodelitschia bisporula TaxID=703511 RepID=A0A6G1HVG5_9PEZI|nr:hypothetical protein EJ06DRAFT_562355 [Trichodelitschia bisporula]
MNAWPHDNLSTTNGFPDAASNIIDPTMFNTAVPFPNAPLHQTPQPQRSQTPHYPYQVNQVIPSKRPRPSDDGLAGSPRLPPTSLNNSRSQTPHQQSYPGGFPATQAPSMPYQHLQGGSTTATPSPTLQNQQFRPPPQRVQTVSPNPGFQQPVMSPPPDANGRVQTPQNMNFPMGAQMNPAMGGHMAGMPTGQMGPGQMSSQMGGQMPMGQQGQGQMGQMPPQMGQMPGQMPPQMSPGQMPQGQMPMQGHMGTPNMMTPMNQQQFYGNFNNGNPMNYAPQVQLNPGLAQRQAETQRAYQIKMMQQQQQMRQGQPMMAPQMTPTRPQGQMNPNAAAAAANQKANSEMAFLKNVSNLMQANGRPFDPNPIVAGKPVNLFALFQIIMKAKGSKRVTAVGQWPQVAQALKFDPSLAMDLKEVFDRLLLPWETAFYHNQMNQRKDGPGPQMSPTRPPQAAPPQTPQNAQQQHQMQQYINQMQQQQRMNAQMTPVQNNAALPANGWPTPQPDSHVHRKSVSRTEPAPQAFPQPSPVSAGKMPERPDATPKANGQIQAIVAEEKPSTNYLPNVFRLSETWGGVYPDRYSSIGETLAKLKPNVPNVEEMGVVDVHALTHSLQSGITGEVRHALDHLVKLSNEQRLFIELERCEDLLDTLVDCGEVQVEALTDDSAEVSDMIDFGAYEDVMRNVKMEMTQLQRLPEAGTREYFLDRAADRLIAITTILRNLSFPHSMNPQQSERNLHLLAAPTVIRFISNAIRLIGTRYNFLRSHLNTQDFMKDVVVFLSNVTDKVSLPSREDALSLLYFLLSFAPLPLPTTAKPLRFSSFNPQIHKYYPPAIDALAKLLARDDPNRAFFRYHLVEALPPAVPGAPVSARYELLTRAFAFAVAIVPDRTSPRGPATTVAEVRIAEARKPTLSQGILAADILSALVPVNEPALAREWIEGVDGWGASLYRLACVLSSQPPGGPPGRPGPRPGPPVEEGGFGSVTQRALHMLARLQGRSLEGKGKVVRGEDEEGLESGGEEEERDGGEEMPLGAVQGEILPKREMLLGALLTPNIDQGVLRELVQLEMLGE